MARPLAAPRIYFSLRSPFSWISLQVLQERRPELLERSELLPFWDPSPDTLEALHALGGDYHYVQMSKAKHLYILQDAKRITRRLGLEMAWPVDRDPRWEVPHLAWLAAEPQDRAGVYDALMAARWNRGENICDSDVVADLLGRAGLDAALAHAHKDQDVVRAGAEVLVRAYKDDVFGIPYFKAGSQRFWGLDRVAWFLACYDRSQATGKYTAPDEPVEVPSLDAAFAGAAYDTDEAGGCG